MRPQLSSFRTSFLQLFITDSEAEKSVVYGRWETAFVEGKNGQFGAGLN
jgi:hypothetical protein